MNVTHSSLLIFVVAIAVPVAAQDASTPRDSSTSKATSENYTKGSIQRGLIRIIEALPNATSAEDKNKLLQWAKKGLKARYEIRLRERQERIDDLQKQLDVLKAEYERRTKATDRIVSVQLESLKLAAEGLVSTREIVKDYGLTEMAGMGMDMDAYGDGGYGDDMEMGGDYGEDYGADTHPVARPTLKLTDLNQDPFLAN